MNPGAIHLLEHYFNTALEEDTLDYTNWETLPSNPAIFTYNYKKMKEYKKELNESIIQEMYSPSRIANYLETNNNVENYLE